MFNLKITKIMKKLVIVKIDGSHITLNFENEEKCSKCFNNIMNTCMRQDIAQINIINTEV